MLEMTLKDSGIGISREAQSRLFEPFSRESRHGKGSGLGLAIVKRIAAQHGGAIELRNRVGGGLEARVSLPLGLLLPRDATKA